MSEPINLAKVAGKHAAIYEAYYHKANPKGAPGIQAMEAATFLKKSTLSDVVLSRIWDLSDPKGRGYLDKVGFFTALKLVALAQEGETIDIASIYMETRNPPKVGDVPKIPPQVPPPAASMMNADSANWAMSAIDEAKYQHTFNSLHPMNGLLPGNKVKGVLLESKLPMDTLGKIWDLADQDKDGSLDIYEFSVAMHLVYHALQKRHIPASLPAALQKKPQRSAVPAPPSPEEPELFAQFPTDLAPPPAVPPPAKITPPLVPAALSNLNLLSDEPPMVPVGLDWVISAEEKRNFDAIFKRSDMDNDDLVSGLEIKDIFLQSGVSQACLAHIWALCDTKQTGKLNSEQFALALWLVERKKKGIDPPNVLAPNMVPPSMRADGGGAVEPPVALVPSKTPEPTYANPELKMMAEEIEKIVTERRALEREMAQRNADIVIKTGEIRSLQKEMDTLTATLKQLEHQKVEAQKRLNDLQEQVKKINEQCAKQEETIKEQEAEVNARRSQLQSLKDEELNLSKEYDQNTKELEGLTLQLQDTQLQISQMKAMITQLQESQRQMRDALDSCSSAIESGDPDIVTDYYLKLNPDFREVRESMESENKPKVVSPPAATQTYSFESKFEDDPFKPKTDDSWGDNHPSGFDDSFDTHFNGQSKGHSDAFGDAFGGTGNTNATAAASDTKDKFDEDPFAILHAPTTGGAPNLHTNITPSSQMAYRSTSPIPALPPKKAKQPPPRPAPPKSMQTKVKQFESESNDFANFADFNKHVNDFSDDPFKNYRYEDPFHIADPFGEDVK